MKWLLLFISVSIHSHGNAQIPLDSTRYYALISAGSWILQSNEEITDSSSVWDNPIDSNYYWFLDSQIAIIRRPLTYELTINKNVFRLHVNDSSRGLKYEFYTYGWFIDSSTLALIQSNKKLTFHALKNKQPNIYKKIN